MGGFGLVVVVGLCWLLAPLVAVLAVALAVVLAVPVEVCRSSFVRLASLHQVVLGCGASQFSSACCR